MSFPRINQNLLTGLIELAGIAVILTPSALTGTGNSILKCQNVFCSPGDTTVKVIVELVSDPADSIAGFQFDQYIDSSYFTPSDSEPWDVSGLNGWLPQTAIRNDAMVSFIAVDSLLNQGHLNAGLACNYFIDKATPSGFYLIQPANVMISGISGDSVGCQLQSGAIIVSKGDVIIKVADETVRVGQKSVVIPITFVAKEGARTIDFKITDSAYVFTLRDFLTVLPPGWTVAFNQDSTGAVRYYAHCDAPLRLGYPIAPNEIITINLIVDINPEVTPQTYLINTQNVAVGDATSDSGSWMVESIAGCLTIIDSTSAITSAPDKLEKFSLLQNYPNPFNQNTTIDFAIEQAGPVRLEVYNLLGQSVKTLVRGKYDLGEYSVIWNGHSDTGQVLESGIYFLCLQTGERVQTRKMVLIK